MNYAFPPPQIHLVPQSLARKRVWNKKYPICIELAKQEDFMSKAQGEKPESVEERPAGGGEKLDRIDKGEKVEGAGSGEEPKRPASGGGDLIIYLFGRTGREKEEWFRRFLLASRLKSDWRGGSLPGICKSGEYESPSNTPSHTHTHMQIHAWVHIYLSALLTPTCTQTHSYTHIYTDTHRYPQPD